jgi:DNA-binding FadR family transcriptional regulator
MTTVELAVKRIDDDGVAALRRALEIEEAARSLTEFVAIGHDLHDVLAAIPENPVLELLTHVLTQLTRWHQASPTGIRARSSDVRHVHEGIVQAIVDRDAELARHRMRRHLDALVAWVS